MSGPVDNDKSFERVLASFLREDLGPSRQGCPHPGVLSAYFDGKLTEGEARELEVHLASCGSCQAEIAVLVRLPPEPAAETGRVEPVVAPPVVAAPTEPSPEPEKIAPPAEPDVEAMRLRAEDVDDLRPVEDLRRWRRQRDGRRRRRRTLWTWLAPVALAASAVLAISVTYRFVPLIEHASRRSLESGSSGRAPESARPLTASRDTNTDAKERLEAPRADLAAPTTAAGQAAPPMPDEMRGAEPGSASPESQPRQKTEAMPPARAGIEPQANPAPTAPAPPAALAPRAEPNAMQALKDEEQLRFADRAVPLPARPAKEERDAALAKAAEAGVVVVAHTNPDVAWRFRDDSIERSDDGGKTWRSQPAGRATGLLVGSAPSASVCWLAGRSGLVLRTTDGEHWVPLASPTTGDLTEIEARDESNATVRTPSGERFSTVDGGESWSKR